MDDLQVILRRTGHQMSQERIRKMIKAAGFRWRKAKVVLTSQDPDYRAKLDAIKKILSIHLTANGPYSSIEKNASSSWRLSQVSERVRRQSGSTGTGFFACVPKSHKF
jgi:hypothetical protein